VPGTVEELEARVGELTAVVAAARPRLGTAAATEEERRRLAEQAGRVGDAAHYFLMGP